MPISDFDIAFVHHDARREYKKTNWLGEVQKPPGNVISINTASSVVYTGTDGDQHLACRVDLVDTDQTNDRIDPTAQQILFAPQACPVHIEGSVKS